MDRNCREPGIVKIADLGMARLFNSPLKVRGSYLPPPNVARPLRYHGDGVLDKFQSSRFNL